MEGKKKRKNGKSKGLSLDVEKNNASPTFNNANPLLMTATNFAKVEPHFSRRLLQTDGVLR